MAINIAMVSSRPLSAVNLMVTARIAGIPLESTFPLGRLAAALDGRRARASCFAFPEIALWLPRVLGYRIT